QILHIQPAMQRRYGTSGNVLEEWKMYEVRMEVDDVELVRPSPHLVHHREMRREVGLERVRIEPDRLIPDGDERRPRLRVCAREEDHIVAQVHQRVRQVGDDPLGAAVEARRHCLVERGNLGNPHRRYFLRGIRQAKGVGTHPDSRGASGSDVALRWMHGTAKAGYRPTPPFASRVADGARGPVDVNEEMSLPSSFAALPVVNSPSV